MALNPKIEYRSFLFIFLLNLAMSTLSKKNNLIDAWYLESRIK